jgi:hypothetical protein
MSAPLRGPIRVAGESLATEGDDWVPPAAGESAGVTYGETTSVGPDEIEPQAEPTSADKSAGS